MIKIATKKRRKISKKAMIIAVIICLLLLVLILIDTIEKVEIQLPENEKAELTSNKNKTEDYVFKEYNITQESKSYNYDNKFQVEIGFSRKLYENDQSNKEYYEAMIKDLVKIYKKDFVLLDEEKNIKIEVFLTSENNYKYKINDIENYYDVAEEKNIDIKNFKEIECKDAEIENKEINKFDKNEWSVKAAGVKILEYGEDYLGYNNYKILTDDIYIDTIILESAYEEEILKGIKVGTSKEEIKEKLGEPTFGDNGYKINDSYMFFYEDEIAIYPNTKFNNKKIEKKIINYINSEEKIERKMFAYEILRDDFDFKSYVDENNVLNIVSVNRGIKIYVDENLQVSAEIYNNYDMTEITKECIRNGIINVNSGIDYIYETEKNRK